MVLDEVVLKRSLPIARYHKSLEEMDWVYFPTKRYFSTLCCCVNDERVDALALWHTAGVEG